MENQLYVYVFCSSTKHNGGTCVITEKPSFDLTLNPKCRYEIFLPSGRETLLSEDLCIQDYHLMLNRNPN